MPTVAATPFVFDGQAPSDLPPDAEPVELSSLRDAPPALLSGLPTTPCAEPAPIDIADIESALLYAELERAEDAVSAAVAWAPCAELSAPDLSALMRTWGLVAAHTGGPAAQRFAIARTLFPDMQWDDRFAPRYREGFDAYEPDLAPTVLTVYPRGDVVIDGRPGEQSLTVGRHLVASGSTGAWVDLLDAPDTLVLPGAYPEGALSWVADETRRAELTALLAVTLGEGERAMVHHDGVTWQGTTGRVDWHALPTAEPTSVVSPPPRRTHPGVPIAVSGGALAVAGVAMTAIGYGMTNANATPIEGTPGSERQTRYNTGRTLYQLGLGATVGGSLLGGAGAGWAVVGAR